MGTQVEEGFTASPNVPGQEQSHESKAGLEAWLAEHSTAPAWLEMYRDLLAERTETKRPRWDWRKALYIAWSATPRNKRWPKNHNELASFLGLTDAATMRHWRLKDPEIDERIQALPREALLGHVAAVFDALATVASDPDARSFQDRQLFLKITGYYQPSKTVELGGQLDLEHAGQVTMTHDLSKLTDEQLDQLAAITEALGDPV